MGARSRPITRSAGEDPTRFSAGIGPDHRTLSHLGQEMAQATARSVIPMTPLCCVLVRGRIMRLTSAGIFVARRRLWTRERRPRVPGPRALLYSLPRDPELQAAQVPLPRSSRTIWKILHTPVAWCSVPKSHPLPTNSASQWKRFRWMQKDVGSVSPEQSSASASVSRWSKSAMADGCRHFDCPVCPGARGFPRVISQSKR
jgi:hypothetical protein